MNEGVPPLNTGTQNAYNNLNNGSQYNGEDGGGVGGKNRAQDLVQSLQMQTRHLSDMEQQSWEQQQQRINSIQQQED